MHIIRVSAAVILNHHLDLLIVRKKGGEFFTLPGGKIEENENPTEALLRELREELGIALKADDFEFLGKHQTKAANEANSIVIGNIFMLKDRLVNENMHSHAEIEEVVWMSKSNWSTYKLAHLLKEFVLPKWLIGF